MKRALSSGRQTVGGKPGTILTENYCQKFYESPRKQNVMLHEWNRSENPNMSKARRRLGTEKPETENLKPTYDEVILIQALQSK